MDLLYIFAEDYGDGSRGTDFLSTEDGSETWQNTIDTNSPSNGEGQGNVPDYGKLNHPISPDGEIAHNSDNGTQGQTEHDSQDSARFTTAPYGEQLVDDNHANNEGGVSAGLLSFFMTKTASWDWKNNEGTVHDFTGTLYHGTSPENSVKISQAKKLLPSKVEGDKQLGYGNGSYLAFDPKMAGMWGDKVHPIHVQNAKVLRIPSHKWHEYADTFAAPDKPYEQQVHEATEGIKGLGHDALWIDDSKGIFNHLLKKEKGIENPDQLILYNHDKASIGEPIKHNAADLDSNFFLGGSTSGGVADSPQIMWDGHADEELERDQQGVKNTINNFDPSTKGEEPFDDPSAFDEAQRKIDDSGKVTPDINKGRTYAWTHWRIPLLTHTSIKRRAAYDTGQVDNGLTDDDGEQSNVDQTMYPDEEFNIQVNKKEDYGNKDYGSDDYMGNAPLQSDTDLETKNYSGVMPTASLLDLFTKHADYGGVMPDANPNSGQDEQDWRHHTQMIDGKPTSTSCNEDDKTWDDPLKYRQNKQKYKRVEDTQNYYNFSGSGSGGTGMEGDGQNFSGISN